MKKPKDEMLTVFFDGYEPLPLQFVYILCTPQQAARTLSARTLPVMHTHTHTGRHAHSNTQHPRTRQSH